MTSTLQHFWQLASSSTKDRLDSAHGLINALEQNKVELAASPALPAPSRIFDDGLDIEVGDSEIREAEDALQQLGSTDIAYTLKRLVKGLASHRESARLGFSVALCELLSRASVISARHITTLILAYSVPSGKFKGQEERDMLFARLFGMYALVRSGLLVNESLASESDARRAVGILRSIARKKVWLDESVARIIVDLIETIKADSVSWAEDIARWLLGMICEAKTVTVGTVAVFMALHKHLPAGFTSKSQRLPHFASQEVLTLPNMSVLSKLLKDAKVEGGDDETLIEGGTASASQTTQAHFIWEMIFAEYVNGGSTSNLPFVEMFRILVDESLFGPTASHQKKSWGFQIWTKALATMPKACVSEAFTPNLMRTLMNQLGGKDRILHKAAQKACFELQAVVRDRPELALIVLNKLTGAHGNVKFDQMTGTKTVESTLRYLSDHQVRSHVDSLVRSLYAAETSGTQISLLDQLLVIARNPTIRADDACLEDIVSLFAAHGLYDVKKAVKDAGKSRSCLSHIPTAPLSAPVQSVCRSHFLSSLSDLHASAAGNVDAVDWIARAEKTLAWLESKSKQFVRTREGSTESVDRAKQVIHALRSRELAEPNLSVKTREHSFTTFLTASALYVVTQQASEEEAQSLLDPIVECAQRLILAPHQDADATEQPGPMELLIDCIASALQPASAFLRGFATDVFDAYAYRITRPGINMLLEQLGFDQDAKDGTEDGSSRAINEGQDSDVESDTSATSSASEMDEDDDELEDDDVDADFAAKVRHALQTGTKTRTVDGEESEELDGGDNGSDLGDDEMLLIDDKLAEVFKEKFSSRKQEDEAKKEEVAFHIRIVDLLDHFAKHHGESEYCVTMVLPLFTIALEKDKTLEPLRLRASKVLQKTLLKGKDAPVNASVNDIAEGLDAVQKMAATSLTSAQQSLASSANLYLTKSALHSTSTIPEPIRAVYLFSLKDFLDRKSNNLRPAFLLDAFQRYPRLGFALRTELLEAAFEPASTTQHAFRQLQALEMVRTSLGQIIAQPALFEDVSAIAVTETLTQVAHLTLGRITEEPQRMKDLLKIALQFARLTRRWVEGEGRGARNGSIGSIWSSDEVQSAFDKLSEGGGTSQLNLMKQLLVLTKPTASHEADDAQKVKRGPAPSNSEDQQQKKRKKSMKE